jgi:hypothetical protein
MSKDFKIHNLSEDTITKIKLIAAIRGETIAQVIEGAIRIDMLKNVSLLSKTKVPEEIDWVESDRAFRHAFKHALKGGK